jgi:hypothetical protein
VRNVEKGWNHLGKLGADGLRFAVLAGFAALGLCGLLSYGQDAPLDASEISRDLLYLAPSRADILLAGDIHAYVYQGSRFRYGQFDGITWTIQPSGAKQTESTEKQRVFPVDSPGVPGPYELVGASDDDRATLTLRKKGTQDALSTVTLWDRDQLVQAWLPEMRKQKRGTTADGLRQDLEVADPEVRATSPLVSVNRPANDSKVLFTLDTSILVAVGQSTGEQELGLATIVKFDPETRQATVYHPANAMTCEVSTIGVNHSAPNTNFKVWFGTRNIREGTISPCGGLWQLDPQTRKVTPAPGAKNPPIGSIVTMLFGDGPGGSLVAATDSGLCNLARASETDWTCWRFVPTVTLKEEAAVANRPGDKPYGQLKPGDYEVLWANQNFLEVATPDSYDAWMAADDYAEAAVRNFDAEPYKLLNTASGGAAPIRPLAKPGGEPLNGALVYRAPLEKLSTPAGTPAGWVRVRARTGWIAREKLEVVPKLLPAKN